MAQDSREADALSELGDVTRRLRAECPWDREQDELSIVAHTVDESYELADAIERGDDEALVDELGDVLFQVYFLSLLMEERHVGSLAQVADNCTRKLVRRHPHVFGELAGATIDADEVRRNWDQIKDDQEGRGADGVFDDVPSSLPALLWARKVQKRAEARAGAEAVDTDRSVATAVGALKRIGSLASSGVSGGPDQPERERQAISRDIGEALFSVVELARSVKVDPELALRARGHRYMEDFGADQGQA